MTPPTCPRGHRIIPSTGDHWTIVELQPGVYRYAIGPCDELPARDLPQAQPVEREVA